MVIVEGVPVWQASGYGVVVSHPQRSQAQLMWHCQAVARGYDGPAPQIKA
jgi:hypothetical protein